MYSARTIHAGDFIMMIDKVLDLTDLAYVCVCVCGGRMTNKQAKLKEYMILDRNQCF